MTRTSVLALLGFLLTREAPEDEGYAVQKAVANRILTTAYADVDGDGRLDRIDVVLAKGFYVEDAEPSFSCGARYQGSLALRVTLRGRKRPVVTSLGIIPLCADPWTLRTADYNRDGRVDFNLGFAENSSNSFYGLFTIRKEGQVERLAIRFADGPSNALTAHTAGNSTGEIARTASGIRVAAWANAGDETGWWVIDLAWDARERVFVEQGRHHVDEQPSFVE